MWITTASNQDLYSEIYIKCKKYKKIKNWNLKIYPRSKIKGSNKDPPHK